MLMFLGRRIADRRLLGLICKWLQAGVMEDGRRVAATKGTPQLLAILENKRFRPKNHMPKNQGVVL